MWCKTPHLPPIAWHVSPGFLSHMHKLLTRWSCKAYLMLTFDWIVLPHQSQCLKKCKILTERRCKCTKVFGELMKWILVWLQTAIYCRQKVETLQTVGQMVGYFNSNKADSFICDVKAYFWWILTSGCTGLMLSKIPQFSMCDGSFGSQKVMTLVCSVKDPGNFRNWLSWSWGTIPNCTGYNLLPCTRLGGLVVRIPACGNKSPEFEPQVENQNFSKLRLRTLKLAASMKYKIHTVFCRIHYGIHTVVQTIPYGHHAIL